ncbi:MAG: hypothetical protein ABSD50_16800 [Smithella sp.]
MNYNRQRDGAFSHYTHCETALWPMRQSLFRHTGEDRYPVAIYHCEPAHGWCGNPIRH